MLTRDEAFAKIVDQDGADLGAEIDRLKAGVTDATGQGQVAAIEHDIKLYHDEAAEPEIRLSRDPATAAQAMAIIAAGVTRYA
jgi:hypothetical protein